MASVTYDGATRIYAKSDQAAVAALDLEVADGEFLVLVGPSGCGKSTSLRMVAGLEEVDEGAIFIGDREVTDVPPKERDVAMVFQNYALYPHMTVADNMSFSLKMARVPKQEAREGARGGPDPRSGGIPRAEAARAVGRPAAEGRHGQGDRAQAAGIPDGRAAQQSRRPASGSNADEIAALQRRLGVTTLYVTHDQVEAMTMGDRVAVLDKGQLQQVDTPNNLYARPVNRFVAGFMGSPAMNLREVAIVAGAADLSGYRIPLAQSALAAADRDREGRVVIGIRPEAFEVVGDEDEGLVVTTEVVEELGSDAFLFASLGSSERRRRRGCGRANRPRQGACEGPPHHASCSAGPDPRLLNHQRREAELTDVVEKADTLSPQTAWSERRRLAEEEDMAQFDAAGRELVEVARVADHTVPVDGGEIRVRAYTPPGAGPFPAVIHFHGGGFVLFSIDWITSVDWCRDVCARTGAVVIDVDYRLAPEHPFPTPAEDSYKALEWTAERARELAIDADRIALAGESAGANLATVVALMARDRDGPAVVRLLLETPAMDLADLRWHRSARDYADGFDLTLLDAHEFNAAYLAHPENAKHPYASPLRAELRGLPPTHLMTAENDILRDGAELFTRRLRDAGVPATARRHRGHVPGSASRDREWHAARIWRDEVVGILRGTFAESAVVDVRAEHLADASGIGVAAPRLSWAIETRLAGWRQSAYEVEARGETVHVDSGESVLVPWPFAPLVSGERIDVRVRACDSKGVWTDWSVPCTVEAGLLDAQDWQARFVSPDWDEDVSTDQPASFLRREFTVRGPVARAGCTRRPTASTSRAQRRPRGRPRARPGLDELPAPAPLPDVRRHRAAASRARTPSARSSPTAGSAAASASRAACREHLRRPRGAARAARGRPTPDGDSGALRHGRGAGGRRRRADHGGEPLRRRGLRRTPRARTAGPRPGTTTPPGRRSSRRSCDAAAPRRADGPARPAHGASWMPVAVTHLAARADDRRLRPEPRRPAPHPAVSGEAGTDDHAAPRRGAAGRRALRPAAARGASHGHVRASRHGCRGGWEPRFTFHGFRYAEIDGWPGEIDAGRDQRRRRTTPTWSARAGSRAPTRCSSGFHENVVWGMRGNFLDVPTDCPQRDERLGWTGDLQVFAPTASFLYDCAGMLTSWLRDLAARPGRGRQRAGVRAHHRASLRRQRGAARRPRRRGGLGRRGGDRAVGPVPAVRRRRRARAAVRLDVRLGRPRGPARRADDLLWDTGLQFGDWLDPNGAARPSAARARPTGTSSRPPTSPIPPGSSRAAAEVLGRREDASATRRWPTAPGARSARST